MSRAARRSPSGRRRCRVPPPPADRRRSRRPWPWAARLPPPRGRRPRRAGPRGSPVRPLSSREESESSTSGASCRNKTWIAENMPAIRPPSDVKSRPKTAVWEPFRGARSRSSSGIPEVRRTVPMLNHLLNESAMNPRYRESVAPAERKDKADIVLVGGRIWRTAVERVEERERREEVLPQLALEVHVCLQPLAAGIAQARIVLKSDIDIRFRAIIGLLRRLEYQKPLEVLGRFDIHPVLLVHRESGANHHLCPGTVDQTRADGGANLRP